MKNLLLLIYAVICFSCNSNDDSPAVEPNTGFFSEYKQRNFMLGFTSWPHGSEAQEVENTYSFIGQNGDIYVEHIDNNIPWTAWINNTDLPVEFVNEINFKKSNQPSNIEMLLSVSVLNLDRDNLANNYDGSPFSLLSLDDPVVIDAYVKHLEYLISEFQPSFLLISIESNEILINAPEKWDGFKNLMSGVRQKIKSNHPEIAISESITLHNLINPDVPNQTEYEDEVYSHIKYYDFAGISFYPFFKGFNNEQGFQEAFDIVNEKISKPIAFTETNHIAEDLVVESFNLNVPGNESEQNVYLQTLITNAQENDYLFVIWWAHRDYDKLWETFPEDVKDLGRLWRDTGLLDEEGNARKAYDSWMSAFNTSI